MANTDLHTHTAHFLHAVRELPIRLELLWELRSHATDPADRETAVNEALDEYSKRVARHSDAILQLTDDERTEALVTEFTALVSLELKIFRDTARTRAELRGNDSGFREVVVKILEGAGGAIERRSRQRLMVLAGEIHEHLYRAPEDPNRDSVAG